MSVFEQSHPTEPGFNAKEQQQQLADELGWGEEDNRQSRERFKKQMAEAGIEVKYGDEVGTELDRYRKPLPPEVADDFNVLTGTADQSDDRKIIELGLLPFVHPKKPEGSERPETWVEEFEFPVERIIGADGLNSWRGRRNAGKDTQTERGASSTDSIIGKYSDWIRAQGDVPELRLREPVRIFKDTDGEYWGYAEDGGHRIAAAKLNGVKTIKTRVSIRPDELMPTYDRSVIDMFKAE